MKTIASQLQTIVSPDSICAWENLDVIRQKRILQALVPETTPSCVVYPNTQAELASVIACTHHNKWRVLPCGSGSKISWGGLAAGVEVVVSTERLNQVIQHAVGDLTVTVESGTKFADLQATLATAGQFLPLDPVVPQSATMGGIIATADTGSWRQRYGGVRDQLLGVTFVRADGQIAKAGGRVVKNVAGYDLMKLFTGSYGTLGIITQVTFRVYPLSSASGTVVLTGTADAVGEASTVLRASALTPTAADFLSTGLIADLGLGEGWGLLVRFQSMTESVEEQSTRILAVGQQLGLQGVLYSASDEAELWQKLEEKIRVATTEPVITCKIGVVPSASMAILSQVDSLAQGALALIHAGSGLGVLRLENGVGMVKSVLQTRSLCQANGGFLTVLEAPIVIKQQLDVWGYSGSALNIMRGIKRQFDPENLLSPSRFVAGI